MGPYLADFCCTELRVIVNVDGVVHGEPSAVKSDARRDGHLKSRGYTVLRLPNGIVLEPPDLFVQEVVSFWLRTEAERTAR